MPNMANGCACTMLRRSVYEVPLSTCSYLPRSGPKGSGGRNCMSSTRIRMTDTAKLTALIAPEVEALGYAVVRRSEEHTSELQSLMRISYAVFCLKKKKT